MYTVINQCAVLLSAHSQWWPRIKLYLLYCSLYSFFFPTFGLTQRQLLTLSFAHVTCSSPICSVLSSATTLFLFKVSSHRFHFKTCNRKQEILLDIDTVREALHFLFIFVPRNSCSVFVESSWWLPGSLFLPGIPLRLPRLPLLFLRKTCLTLTMLRLSRQQRPVRSRFAPRMRRNRPSGSASSRHSSPWQASNHRNSGTPMLWPACPSKSYGRCLQRIRSTFWSLERSFA